MNKVGAFVSAWNEVACISFTLDSLLQYVDPVVFIDMGSEDGTWELVQSLFSHQIQQGHLTTIQLGFQNFNVGIGFQTGITALRDRGCDYLLRVDADEVFYDQGIKHLVDTMASLNGNVTHISSRKHELYQSEALYTLDWLRAIKQKRKIFYSTFLPVYTYGFRVLGASSGGLWTDEFEGKPPCTINVSDKKVEVHINKILSTHYGWARPTEKKREKVKFGQSKSFNNPWIDQLQNSKDAHMITGLFDLHPEAIGRMIDPTLNWYRSRE